MPVSPSLSRRVSRPIFRVRTGCLTCRGRKKKCDETKPKCRGCERNHLVCRWPQPSPEKPKPKRAVRPPLPASAAVPNSAAPDPAITTAIPSSSTSTFITAAPATTPTQTLSPTESVAISSSSPSTTSSLPIIGKPLPVDESSIVPWDDDAFDPVTSETASCQTLESRSGEGSVAPSSSLVSLRSPTFGSQNGSMQSPAGGHAKDGGPFVDLDETEVPRNIRIFPGFIEANSSELLRHYLGVTAVSMSNGSTAENPFSVQLIPMAFSSDLVLQLILTQSAVHRASRLQESPDSSAARQYHHSLQLFQQTISSYISSHGIEETLALGIGALIMCFVETAKGDTNGTIFRHLLAARTLLVPLLPPSGFVPESLRRFLVEYYVYTAALSMITIDAANEDRQALLSDDLEALAHGLVASGYVGHMCGCWLELILIIPAIFDLAHTLLRRSSSAADSAMTGDNGTQTQSSSFATAEDFAVFAALQARILSWSPPPTVSTEAALAGGIYQQAVLLYLYTALHPLPHAHGSFGANVGTSTGAADTINATTTTAAGATATDADTAAADAAASASATTILAASTATAVDHALAKLAQLSPTARLNTSLCWPVAVVGSCVADRPRREFLLARLGQMFGAIGLGNIRQTEMLLRRMWATPAAAEAVAAGAGPWRLCQAMDEHQIRVSFA